jgi:hypothetical protein
LFDRIRNIEPSKCEVSAWQNRPDDVVSANDWRFSTDEQRQKRLALVSRQGKEDARKDEKRVVRQLSTRGAEKGDVEKSFERDPALLFLCATAI